MLTGLPKNGPTDPIEYYRRPWVGRFYLERINCGLALLPSERPGRALEIGYGAGAVLVALANGVQELHGIDLDADPTGLVELLRSRNQKADLRHGTVYALPYADDLFDLVVSFSVFEHLHRYQVALSEVHRVLRPGGHFLLGMPAVNKLMEAAFLAVGFKGINDHHVTRPLDVARVFEATGFREVGQSSLDFPARPPLGIRLYHNWLLEKVSSAAPEVTSTP
jgi:ubiquinone/menaquinone biosynthesis C-methylase UbiE